MEPIITPECAEMQSLVANLQVSSFLTDFQSAVDPGQSIVPCAAYDIGSGATKFMGALINVETLTIQQIFSQGSFPVSYRQDLNQFETNEFSDLIQEIGLKALETAKHQIEQDYVAGSFQGYGEIQHFAIATAAFREAKNGELVASYFEEKLAIPVSIISQEEEGKLAYYSAYSQIEHEGEEVQLPVVWDIGGGSMQLTFKDQADNFHVMGGTVASQTFQSLISDTLLHKEPTASPNPMSEADVEAAIALAKAHLLFDPTATDIIKNQISNNAPVIAVGSVHNYSVQTICNLAGVNPQDNYYTKEDVHYAIDLLTNKSDKEIQDLILLPCEDFAKNQLTNLILVYAMMDILEIKMVETVRSGNVEGLLLKNAPSKQENGSTKVVMDPSLDLSEVNLLPV